MLFRSVLLSSVSIENLAKGITAVGLLGGIVSGMVVATRGASSCYKNLIVMAVIIALLAAVVYAFYTLDDTDKLYAAVGAISIVFGAFALILETSKNCKDIKISTLLLMLGAVLVLSGILILLYELKVDSCIEAAGSFEDYKDLEEVDTYDEYVERWKWYYPDERYWYNVIAVRRDDYMAVQIGRASCRERV